LGGDFIAGFTIGIVICELRGLPGRVDFVLINRRRGRGRFRPIFSEVNSNIIPNKMKTLQPEADFSMINNADPFLQTIKVHVDEVYLRVASSMLTILNKGRHAQLEKLVGFHQGPKSRPVLQSQWMQPLHMWIPPLPFHLLGLLSENSKIQVR
jgi:hypothetical protein